MTDKIKNILEQMTIEEKATMVCGDPCMETESEG